MLILYYQEKNCFWRLNRCRCSHVFTNIARVLGQNRITFRLMLLCSDLIIRGGSIEVWAEKVEPSIIASEIAKEMFNMAKNQKSYTLEFKQQIVDLYNADGKSYPQLEREYGISRSTLSTWVKQLPPVRTTSSG